MSPHSPSPEELLSACHDGELTPAEQTEVDRLLGETPSLQETLDDYRELTAILQSIPRPAAPAVLQQNVLRQIASRTTQPASRTSRRRGPWVWGVSLLATAALLFVMLRVNSNPHESVAHTASGGAPSDEALAMAESAEDRAVAQSVAPFAESVEYEREVSSAPMLKAAAGSANGDSAAGGFGAPASAPEMSSAARPQARVAQPARAAFATEAIADGGSEIGERLNLRPGSPPKATDVLGYVERVGNQTVVVEFDVVDVSRTMDDLVVLLQRRGVRVVGAVESDEDRSYPGQANAAFGGASAAPLVALYLEAPEPELAGVIDEVMSHVSIQEGTTYNADAAGPLLNGRLVELESKYLIRDEAPPEVEPATPPAAPAVKERAEGSAGAAVPRIASAGVAKTETADDAAPLAQGVRLNLPTTTFRKIEVRESVAMSGRAPVRGLDASTQQPGGARPFEGPSVEQRSRNVAPRNEDAPAAAGEESDSLTTPLEAQQVQRLLIVLQPEERER